MSAPVLAASKAIEEFERKRRRRKAAEVDLRGSPEDD
jgi:hypothetical protein